MNENDFNLDEIMSEFSDIRSSVEDRPAPEKEAERKTTGQPAGHKTARAADDDAESIPVRRKRRPASEIDETTPRTVRRRAASDSAERRNSTPDITRVRLAPEKNQRTDSDEGYPDDISGSDRQTADGKVSFAGKLFGGIVFLAVLAVTCLWLLVNIHPGTATVKTENVKELADLTPRFENLANNLASDALSDITYIKKVYSIPEDASVAPKPNSACYGESYDPEVIQGIIDGAAELLDGQDMVWNKDIVTYDNTPVKYYYDETILSLVWKEVVGNTVFTFSEIKIADGSQLRRALAGDAYSSEIQLKASEMASAVNAVTAMNGDFYAFRQVGIVVYKRNLERFEPSTLDSCFFTSGGDMIFAHRGELTSEEDTVRFIEENDIIFSTSFGPILVENGELYKTSDYPVGEIFTKYARSAIGMTDSLHYLLMATSSEKNSGYLAGVYVSTAGEIMYNKGCKMAYELDGGQTAVIIHNNTPANEIVYGSERIMSDIIYFATAIPEGER